MAALLPLAALSAAVWLGAPSVDGALGARAEIRAGSAPVDAVSEPEAAVASELTPIVAVRLASERGALIGRYYPRLFWRQPNSLELDRPLLLHRGSISHERALSRRVLWRGEVRASQGELDYSSAEILFDPSQASVVDVSIIDFFETQATAAFVNRLDRKNALDLSLSAGHRRPLDADQSVSRIFPDHTFARFAPQYRLTLSRLDALAFPLTMSLHDFSDGTRLVATGADIEWRRRTGLTSNVELSAGALYVDRLESSEGTPRQDEIVPSAGARFTEELYRSRTTRLDAGAAASVRGIVDEVRGELRPIAGVEAFALLGLGSRWSLAPRFGFFTSATAEPLEGEPVETSLTAAVPAVYALSSNVSLEAGVRASARAPHLSENFELEQEQLWVYVGFAGAIGTRAAGSRWAL